MWLGLYPTAAMPGSVPSDARQPVRVAPLADAQQTPGGERERPRDQLEDPAVRAGGNRLRAVMFLLWVLVALCGGVAVFVWCELLRALP
jgi:hypothetical protein